MDANTLYEWSVKLKACEAVMAAMMKKMADEICGSLELMGGEWMGGVAEGGGGRGGGVNPLLLSLLLLIKERYYTAACLFILSERERERGWEQQTDCESERAGIMGDAESETASLPLCRASPADVHYQAQARRHRGSSGEGGSCRVRRARFC